MNALADLLRRAPAEQIRSGYADTAREIAQQPDTWPETARTAVNARPVLRALLGAADVRPGGAGLVVLSGSGSSLYVAECAAMPLQQALQTTVRAIPSGQMLTHLDGCVPPGRPGLCLSLARSGDSPESTAVVDQVLAARPAWQHLIITCNGAGRLATRYAGRPGMARLILAERTCDRSLVMTSSFTNLLLATHMLASLDDPGSYLAQVDRLGAVARYVLDHSAVLATTACGAFRSAMFLGSGSRLGAAREAALKMVEMTAGGVPAAADTFLGLRHGPMSSVHADTLVICFLASDPLTRICVSSNASRPFSISTTRAANRGSSSSVDPLTRTWAARSLTCAIQSLVLPMRAMPVRSLPSRNFAYVQPWFSSPTNWSAGTRTSSKKTSLTS